MNPALSSVRLKIDRAKEHFNYLSTAVNTRSAEQADKTISTELEANGRGFKLPEEPSIHLFRWALIVGDIFHNLRCALDHLVLQLALLNGASLRDASESTFFPVCMSGDEFRSSVKRFKQHISFRALAAIKTLQPYYRAKLRGVPAVHSHLYIISKLDNIDKHRMLVVVDEGCSINDVTIKRTNGIIVKPTIRPDVWTTLKDRADLSSVDFSSVELEVNEVVNMDVYASVDVFLNEPELGLDAMRLRILLRQSIIHVETIVDSFGKMFFGE
jgi:hypothetical protein